MRCGGNMPSKLLEYIFSQGNIQSYSEKGFSDNPWQLHLLVQGSVVSRAYFPGVDHPESSRTPRGDPFQNSSIYVSRV